MGGTRNVLLGCVAYAMIGKATAQQTTISLFLPDTDPRSLVASIVGAVRSHPFQFSATNLPYSLLPNLRYLLHEL